MYKYALLISVGYNDNKRYQLKDSYNEILLVNKYLIEKEGYLSRNITILTDSSTSNGSFYDALHRPDKRIIFNCIEDIILKSHKFIDPIEFKLFYIGYGRNINDSDLNINRNECMLCSCGDIILADELVYFLNMFNSITNIHCILDSCLCNCSFDFTINSQNKKIPKIDIYLSKDFRTFNHKENESYRLNSGIIIKTYLDTFRRKFIYNYNNRLLLTQGK